jgi:hypothetical protein
LDCVLAPTGNGRQLETHKGPWDFPGPFFVAQYAGLISHEVDWIFVAMPTWRG